MSVKVLLYLLFWEGLYKQGLSYLSLSDGRERGAAPLFNLLFPGGEDLYFANANVDKEIGRWELIEINNKNIVRI